VTGREQEHKKKFQISEKCNTRNAHLVSAAPVHSSAFSAHTTGWEGWESRANTAPLSRTNMHWEASPFNWLMSIVKGLTACITGSTPVDMDMLIITALR
jgi:hypothetical protein